jgi:hypothetical protein
MPILIVVAVIAVFLLFTKTAVVTVPIGLLLSALFLWGVYRKKR